MAKVISQKEATLQSTLTDLSTPRLALLTTATDLNDPSTWTEASYSGYSRQNLSGLFGSITADTGGYLKVTWPTSAVSFGKNTGSGVTIVGWAVCEGTGAISTAARRSNDTPMSLTVTNGQRPRVRANSFTSRTK